MSHLEPGCDVMSRIALKSWLTWGVVGLSAVVAVGQALRPAVAQDTSTPDETEFRKPERAALGEAELEAKAKELRELYAKPPAEWPAATVDAGVDHVELGRAGEMGYPADNPPTAEKLELGKKLFFDPALSGSGQISCASCHDPDLAWADGKTLAFGHGRAMGKRNTPGLVNVGHERRLFWDGRAKSLEDQALGPISNEIEMHADPQEVVDRIALKEEYRKDFEAAFGSPEINLTTVAKAIATFERSIVSGRSRFDQFLQGRERLTDSEMRGLHLFRTDARCINCHNGPNFADGQFHDLGLSYYGRELEDLGRYKITNDPRDVGKFKTPTLRNVMRTGPYMHNGLFEIDGVINMYNAGMATLRKKPGQEEDVLFPVKSPLLKPLGLNDQDHEDLKAFLGTLSEPKLRVRPPGLELGRQRRAGN